MQYPDTTYEEPDGTCEQCGQDLDTDPEGDHDHWHRLCWTCWRRDEPDDEPEDWEERW